MHRHTFTYKKKTNTRAKMATPSLSKDPATERDMYEGTIAINAAAVSPAPCPRISLTSRYAAKEQKAENNGAVNTQTCKAVESKWESSSNWSIYLNYVEEKKIENLADHFAQKGEG